MLEKIKEICSKDFHSLIDLLFDDEEGLDLGISSLVALTRDFINIRKYSTSSLCIPTVSEDKEKLCVYNKNTIKVFDLRRQIEVKEISSVKKIDYAFLSNQLVYSSNDIVSIYTNNGIALYSFNKKHTYVPKIFSDGDIIIIDYRFSFIVVDPYRKKHIEIQKDMFKSICGYVSDYVIINKAEDCFAVIIEANRKISSNVKTVCRAHSIKYGSKMYEVGASTFGKRATKTNMIIDSFSYIEDQNIFLQAGNGVHLKMKDIEDKGIAFLKLGTGNKGLLFNGKYSYGDNAVYIYTEGKSMYIYKQDTKSLTLMFSIKCDGMNLSAIQNNNKLLIMTDSIVHNVDISNYTVKRVMSKISTNRILKAKEIKSGVLVTSYDNKNNEIYIDHVIKINDNKEEEICEAV